MNRWASVLAVGLAILVSTTAIATRVPPFVTTTLTSATTTTLSRSTTITSATTVTSEQTNIVTTTAKNRTVSLFTTATRFVTISAAGNECPLNYPQANSTDSTLSNGTKITEVRFPVLLLTPGIEGRICVRYSNVSQTATSVVNASGEITPNGGTTSGEVVMGANATQISVIKNGTQTILYAIVASGGAKGTYQFGSAQFWLDCHSQWSIQPIG